MSDHGIAPIGLITLSNLKVWKRTNFSNRVDFEAHAPVPDIENGELYQTEKQYRPFKVSEHFTAGDFARAGTKTYNFARIHRDLVYELEKIRTFFNTNVNIINGYRTHVDWLKLGPIEKNYVAGQAARIRIPGVPGPQLAKFAIFIGNKDTSISVGKSDIILAVNQKKPIITSHIGEEQKNKGKSRVIREQTVAPLEVYYDFFLGKHWGLTADLYKHYVNLRDQLLKEKPNIGWGFTRPAAVHAKILNEQRQIILNLHQNHHLPADFIINLLFYSDYFNLQRTYLKLAAYYRGIAKTSAAHKAFAMLEIGNILCPGLKAFRERFNKHGTAKYPCTTKLDAIEIPILLNNRTTDRDVLLHLNNLVQETTKGAKRIPRAQTKPVLGANSNENRPDKPKPDRPKYDITGRYELKGKNYEKDIGETLVINQTGLHFEGFHSYLYRPPKGMELTNLPKFYYRIHGRQVEDHFTGYYYDPQWAGHEITIILKDRKTLLVQFRETAILYSELKFKKISTRSTHLSIDVVRASDLIKFHEWTPLLQRQIANIKKNFSGKGLKKIDKLLDEYYDTSNDNDQRKYAKKIDDLFKRAFNNQNNGIHPTDSVLAAHYISSLLAKDPWAPDGEKRKLTRYDYLRRMVEEQQVREIKGEVITIRDWLNLPDLSEESTRKTFTYKVSINLKGFSGKWGPGGGAFLGTLTIEKTAGEGTWKIDKDEKKNEVEYFVAIAGVAAGWGWNFKIKGQADFSDSVEWLPEDFSGWGQLIRGSLSASASIGKAGGSGFFIIHDRRPGTFRAEFLNTGLGFQKKADKPKLEGELSLYKMYIGEDNAKEGAVIIEATKIPKDYNLIYGKKKATFNGHDSAFLTPDARELLRIMCASELALLERNDVEITVEGHTDRTGTNEHNKKLGNNRAANVKLALRDIMGQKLQIADDKIKTPKDLGESLAESEAGDFDAKENPTYRGVRVLINGRVSLTLDGAFAK